MLSFDTAKISVTQLNQIQPGDVFFRRCNGNVSMAVRMIDNSWLNLTGDTAFEFGADNEDRKKLFPVGINIAKVKLRIDQSSVASNDDEHKIGRLLLDGDGNVGIAAAWPSQANNGSKYVMLLKSFTQQQMESPLYLFDRWALSYLDDGGQWVDVVRREPAA